ncbi:unnamed protein product [Symbiodinium natans]|uniref:Uncharacterized protein n=1 Tax=Symbiodinium natans TaxID=878477 RepID=A0A812U0K2_9DINO|nr:unnamed protein product [Symbiodinium natans]
MAKTWTSTFYIYLIISCQMLPLCSMRAETDFEDELEAGHKEDSALQATLRVTCGSPRPTDDLDWVMNPLNADLHSTYEPEVECNSDAVESGTITTSPRDRATKVGDWVGLAKSGASLVGAVVGDVAEAVAEASPVGVILTLQSAANSHLDRNALKRQLQEARARQDRGGEAEALCLLELNMFNRKVLIASTAIGIAGLVGAIATLGTAAPIIVTVGMLLKRFAQKKRTALKKMECAELQTSVDAVDEAQLRADLGSCDPNQQTPCDSTIVWTVNPLYAAMHGGA